MNIFLIKLLFLSNILELIEAESSFLVSFQSSGTVSTEEWMEYSGELPRMQQFTACHWQYTRNFNKDFTNIWSYCSIKNSTGATMQCSQFWTEGIKDTANRHRNVGVWINEGRFQQNQNIIPFRHRTWNHFCWSFTGDTSKIYYNGKLMGSVYLGATEKSEVIEGSKDVMEDAFLIGQDPDEIRGGFDLSQVFKGDITELNMWDKPLDDSSIVALSECRSVEKGNVVAWQKNMFKINKAVVKPLEDIKSLCKEKMKLAIFPTRKPLVEAKSLCSAHGGKLFTPYSKEQNQEMKSILNHHLDQCLDQESGRTVWLGADKRDGIWYEVGRGSRGKVMAINYTNWVSNKGGSNYDCSYMQDDGKWEASENQCPYLSLCTVCSISGTPVFTLKGVCDASNVNYNYYLETDEKGLVYYSGSLYGSIKNLNKTWRLAATDIEDYSLTNYFGGSVLGRRTWEVLDPVCNIVKKQKMILTISKCEFGKKFTCDSGTCINIFKQCDGYKHCKDGSDEENCVLVKIPKTYRKSEAPEIKKNGPLPLVTHVDIINIDFIDSIKMIIGLTIEVRIKWKDQRLTFTDLFEKENDIGNVKKIPEELASNMWLPIPEIIHDNAVIGEIKKDDRRNIQVMALTHPWPLNVMNQREEQLFDGTDQDIIMAQRFKMEYRCSFNFLYFPFDKQSCDFIMKLEVKNNNSLNFIKNDPSITYKGPHQLNIFQVVKLTTSTMHSSNQTSFIFSMEIFRLYFNQLITNFFQTILLLLLAYLTFFIDITKFSERFMGSVTALLVLAALLSTIRDEVPKTSYFKYIDIWFLWHILNIFLISLVHIIVDKLFQRKMSRAENINTFVIFTFPLLNISFWSLYFWYVIQERINGPTLDSTDSDHEDEFHTLVGKLSSF